MEPIVPHKKLEPGVFQGLPETITKKNDAPSSPRIIRTMRSDTAEVSIKHDKTFISTELEGKEKSVTPPPTPRTEFENTAPVPKRIGRMVVVGVLALITVLSVLAYIFILPKLGDIKIPSISIKSPEKPPETIEVPEPEIVPVSQSIIPAQYEKRFNLSTEIPAQMIANVAAERGQGNTMGSIKNLYFFEEGVSLDQVSIIRLLNFAGISAPEILSRSLDEEFMAGFFGESDGGATPFIILKVSEYDTGIAGMLEWEPSLPRFFDTIFGTRITDSGNTRFSDIIVAEKDARMLDVEGNDTIAYVFANENTIVIAGSQKALEAIVAVAGKN